MQRKRMVNPNKGKGDGACAISLTFMGIQKRQFAPTRYATGPVPFILKVPTASTGVSTAASAKISTAPSTGVSTASTTKVSTGASPTSATLALALFLALVFTRFFPQFIAQETPRSNAQTTSTHGISTA